MSGRPFLLARVTFRTFLYPQLHWRKLRFIRIATLRRRSRRRSTSCDVTPKRQLFGRPEVGLPLAVFALLSTNFDRISSNETECIGSDDDDGSAIFLFPGKAPISSIGFVLFAVSLILRRKLPDHSLSEQTRTVFQRFPPLSASGNAPALTRLPAIAR
jgi:hypothetical protein